MIIILNYKLLIHFYVSQIRRIHVSNVAPISIQAKDEQKAQAKAAEAKPKRLKTFSIYRWNPDAPSEKPRMQSYTVDLNR